MRNPILIIGLLALALLAYFVLGRDSSEGKDESAKDKASRADSSDKASSNQEFVRPRRMRSKDNLAEDQLSVQKPRRMSGMGKGSDLRSNKGNALVRPGDRGVVAASEQEKSRAEVMARRSRQWLLDADKDSDGFLSRSEAELGGSQLRRILEDYDAADGDGDGQINIDELKTATQAWNAARLERRRGR